jgi:tRNA(fMet)-specific endonuclease VapC
LYRLLREYQNRDILLFDDLAVAEFKRLKQRKIRIGTMDLRIASIVLVHGAILITMNRRDYEKVPGLRVEDWTTG